MMAGGNWRGGGVGGKYDGDTLLMCIKLKKKKRYFKARR